MGLALWLMQRRRSPVAVAQGVGHTGDGCVARSLRTICPAAIPHDLPPCPMAQSAHCAPHRARVGAGGAARAHRPPSHAPLFQGALFALPFECLSSALREGPKQLLNCRLPSNRRRLPSNRRRFPFKGRPFVCLSQELASWTTRIVFPFLQLKNVL